MLDRQAATSPLMHMPNEIFFIIANFLDTEDVNSFLRTSRLLASILDLHLYERARSHLCHDEKSVLEWAAERDQAPIIRKLLSRTKDAPIPPEAKGKALCLAAQAGMHCAIEILVAAGADASSMIYTGRKATYRRK
jgi:hypothetical protein